MIKSKLTSSTFRSALTKIAELVPDVAVVLGETSYHKLIYPVIALRSNEVSRSTTLKFISTVSELKSGTVAVDELPDWMKSKQAIEHLSKRSCSACEIIQKSDQEIRQILEKVDVEYDKIIKSITRKKSARVEEGRSKNRKKKIIGIDTVLRIERRSENIRDQWFKDIMKAGLNTSNIAMLIRPTYLLGLRTSELFTTRMLIVDYSKIQDLFHRQTVMDDVSRSISDGKFIDIRYMNERNIEEKSAKAMEYMEKSGSRYPPIMKVKARKQGQA